jgi:hypothetical protein
VRRMTGDHRSNTDIRFNAFRSVVRAMQVLAMTEDEQVRLIGDFTVVGQELAMELLDPMKVLAQTNNTDVFTSTQSVELHAIVALVQSRLTQRERRPHSTEWDRIRELAAAFVQKYVWQHEPTRDEFDAGWR